MEVLGLFRPCFVLGAAGMCDRSGRRRACCSYGVLLGASSGVVRDSASLILATYFKRRRELVEAISMSGTGLGVAIFSAIYSLSARYRY